MALHGSCNAGWLVRRSGLLGLCATTDGDDDGEERRAATRDILLQSLEVENVLHGAEGCMRKIVKWTLAGFARKGSDALGPQPKDLTFPSPCGWGIAQIGLDIVYPAPSIPHLRLVHRGVAGEPADHACARAPCLHPRPSRTGHQTAHLPRGAPSRGGADTISRVPIASGPQTPQGSGHAPRTKAPDHPTGAIRSLPVSAPEAWGPTTLGSETDDSQRTQVVALQRIRCCGVRIEVDRAVEGCDKGEKQGGEHAGGQLVKENPNIARQLPQGTGTLPKATPHFLRTHRTKPKAALRF